MRDAPDPALPGPAPVVVIGAGIGGLACALRLAAAGLPVLVLERAPAVGGKMRVRPTEAGPVDAGPTVFTMRHVFDDLFAAAGARMEDHLNLMRAPVLARHWWADGATLDLTGDPMADRAAIEAMSPGAGAAFARFDAETRALFDAFDAPVMQAGRIAPHRVAAAVLTRPVAMLRGAFGSRTLAGYLGRRFRDGRLRQLFGRYATYVGGMPHQVPAILALIWQAEARGVWAVEGGLHGLARAIAGLARRHGAEIRTGCEVAGVDVTDGRAATVRLADGTRIAASAVVFNGDPAALASGLLGPALRGAVRPAAVRPRALSACVWSFAARAHGLPLSHHNVLFGAEPDAEFAPIARGALPEDFTLYICAQDRAGGAVPDGVERFEIILNAPAGLELDREGRRRCHERVMEMLAARGLTFDPPPGVETMCTPQDFATLFPGSDGSLYGRSPAGMAASFARPVARSRIAGLYLAGGGVHPGPGVPMAALSGRHAAEAILRDLASTSTCPPTAMPGGMSTD